MSENPFSQLMKQAQQMQEKMKQAQAELSTLIVVGEAGGGIIKIEMNGQHIVQRTTLSPEFSNEPAAIQASLITAAFNDASQKIESSARGKIANMTAGLDLPKDMFEGKSE